MMRKLLRKDWRVNRPAVLGAVVLAACPYAYMFLVRALFPPDPTIAAWQVIQGWQGAAVAGLGLTLVMGAVFGGLAFAAERRDRPAEFLAMLPVSRRRIALSKLLVVFACTAVPAGIHVAVAVALIRRESEFRRISLEYMTESFIESLVVWACVFILLFGLAWMLSLNLKSPAIAATVAAGVGVMLLFVTSTWAHEAVREGAWLGWRIPSDITEHAVAGMSLGVGAIVFLLSTVHYLRRVEP